MVSGISELTRAIGKFGVPKVPRKCHSFEKLRASSEAKPKNLVNEKEILHFAALRSE